MCVAYITIKYIWDSEESILSQSSNYSILEIDIYIYNATH